MRKYCPNCNEEFKCKEDDILVCQCVTVRLSIDTRKYIAHHFEGCLCLKCLQDFEEKISSRKLTI